MTPDLGRLLTPGSIAVIGDAAWCRSVITGLQSIGYVWDILPVHPTEAKIAGIRTFRRIADLPYPPDLALVGMNAPDVVPTLSALSVQGAGGAILSSRCCDPTAALQDAAGDMPVLGPNFGLYINALDRIKLGPDVEGWTHVPRGVAILTQDFLSMHDHTHGRGLSIGYLVDAGDAALTGQADLGAALLSDPRVTALGMHIEKIGDLRRFEALARVSRDLGKPIVVLKSTLSGQISEPHVGLDALLARLGMARVHSFAAFLETLKLLHSIGPLPANQIAALSGLCKAPTLIREAAAQYGLAFAPLGDNQKRRLREMLGPEATLSNPLVLKQSIQTDEEALTDVFTQMMQGGAVLTLLIVDGADDSLSSDIFEKMRSAAALAHAHVGMPMAMVTCQPDVLPEAAVSQIAKGGVIPMMGVPETMAAIAAAISLGGIKGHPAPLLLPCASAQTSDSVRSVVGAQALAALGPGIRGADPDDPAGAQAMFAVRVLSDPSVGYVLIVGLETQAVAPQTSTPLVLPTVRHELLAEVAQLAAPEAKTSDLGHDAVVDAILTVQGFVEAQAGRVLALTLILQVSDAGNAIAREVTIEHSEDAGQSSSL